MAMNPDAVATGPLVFQVPSPATDGLGPPVQFCPAAFTVVHTAEPPDCTMQAAKAAGFVLKLS